MLEQELTSLAREKLLEKKYGMFDWVEKLLEENDLLTLKPRLLRQQISILLTLELKDIPYQTFYSWLKRYRENHSNQSEKKRETIEKEENKEKSWEDFKPTKPEKKIDNQNILTPVNYDKQN